MAPYQAFEWSPSLAQTNLRLRGRPGVANTGVRPRRRGGRPATGPARSARCPANPGKVRDRLAGGGCGAAAPGSGRCLRRGAAGGCGADQEARGDERH